MVSPPEGEEGAMTGAWKLSEDGKTLVSEGTWASEAEAFEAAKKFIDQLEEADRNVPEKRGE